MAWQARQTASFEIAHGGRVLWDESTISFAMMVAADLEAVDDEVR